MHGRRTGHDYPEEHPGWLWRDEKLIPRGNFTMVVGFDGMGKSTWTLSLVADLTTGKLSGEKETVFLAMAEDGDSITKARLTASGTDLDQIRVQPAGDSWVFPQNEEAFKEYVARENVTVAVLDSLDFHVDNLSGQNARMTLGRLRGFAETIGMTIIVVHHFNKTGRNIDSAIGGGRGIKAAMRCILVWGESPPPDDVFGLEDDDDETEEQAPTHVLAVHKNSYGEKFPIKQSKAYRAFTVPNPFDMNETVMKYEYTDDCSASPQDVFIMRSKDLTGEHQTKQETAKNLIVRFLAMAGDWMRADELEQNVMAAGISQRTVAQARSELSKEGAIENEKQGAVWYWRIKVPAFPPS